MTNTIEEMCLEITGKKTKTISKIKGPYIVLHDKNKPRTTVDHEHFIYLNY